MPYNFFSFKNEIIKNIWRPPSLSELTPMIFNTGLTHLGSEASKCFMLIFQQQYNESNNIK